MENEFVSYTQALALKELGFKEDCFGYYRDYGTNKFYSGFVHLMPKRFRCTKAPLYQQAFKFFREKHGMLGCIEFVEPEYGGDYGYKLYYKPGHLYIDHWNKGFKSYEEAEQACLDKLIEITKTKNNEQAN
jgi:hypothetical protein